jgi:hypothetical protein
MSIVPAFEIGVWNAWILAVPWILGNVVPVLFRENIIRKSARMPYLHQNSRKTLITQ